MWGDVIAIVAIVSIFIGTPLAVGWARHNRGLSAADRQLIESLKNSTIRLEQRVSSLERALLDAETGYAQQRTEV